MSILTLEAKSDRKRWLFKLWHDICKILLTSRVKPGKNTSILISASDRWYHLVFMSTFSLLNFQLSM